MINFSAKSLNTVEWVQGAINDLELFKHWVWKKKNFKKCCSLCYSCCCV